MSDLLAAVDAEWCAGLGCPPERLHRPGVHLTPGGKALAGYEHVYLARLGPVVLVYCPPDQVEAALKVLWGLAPDEVFSPEGAARLGGDRTVQVLGPSRHAFLDQDHFRPADGTGGERLAADDPDLFDLRRACGEAEWGEAGFGVQPGEDPLYGIRQADHLVAAGNLTSYRGHPADVGVLTHPAHRGRGLGRSLVSRMVEDALVTTEIVRYRALVSNTASLSVAARLGFVPRGENLVARLSA